MKMKPRSLLATLALALPLAVAAQTPDATDSPNPGIEDLAWIAGTWATDLEDQVLEERWSAPMANAMTGSFRWSRDGAVWLYEFLLIEETDDGLFYYLRHFGPGSVGWEERDAPLAYQLDSLAPNRAEFASVAAAGDSFVFSREDDQLTIEIVSGDDIKRFVYSLQEVEAEEASAVPATGEPADEPVEPTGDGEATADTTAE